MNNSNKFFKPVLIDQVLLALSDLLCTIQEVLNTSEEGSQKWRLKESCHRCQREKFLRGIQGGKAKKPMAREGL